MPSDTLPAQLFRTGRFTHGVPGQFTVAPDGATVLYLRSRAGDDPRPCLWALDTQSGTERLLADPAELLASRGIDSYATDAAVTKAAFTLDGGLWTADVATGVARRLPVAGTATDARPDPTGRRIGYVRDDEALWLIETDGTDNHAVATPEGPAVAYGRAEHTGATSPSGPRGYWWAPDGEHLLMARTDSTAVQLWYTADPAAPADTPRPLRHAAAGTPQADVTLWLTALDGTRTETRWDRTALPYVTGAGWDAQGPYAVVQSRDQRTVLFLGIDPADGTTSILDERHDKAWVQCVPGLPARLRSGDLVNHADLRNTRHLTLDGTPVTPQGLQLREVLGIDGDEVLFTASGEPTETHLWTYSSTHGLRRLSDEPGVHAGARRGGTLVRIARRADRPGGHAEVVRPNGPAVPIASRAELPVLDVHPTHLVLGERDLRATLHLPSWHRPGEGRLPVLLDPYGGAARQRVTTELDWSTLLSQWFAEQGFAVLVADGRGTPGRGPEWERAVHGDLFGPVLEDQVTALHEAAGHFPDLDLGRVGIRGWSYSGSLAAFAVMHRPDVFHAAVAGAGVTDQRLYGAHWRERFLGHPDEHPERYRRNSLLLAAPRLTRPLLLIHGLCDTNVHPANTLRLSEALLHAGRPHEVLLLPGTGHRAIGGPLTEPLLNHQAEFLRRHLKAS
ncbi:S9 family peptidase [Streptomyces montanisoli]|uniref:S9 family peptidase n=1 Tax=Streptomyces montanisoli TaxID=2798581 RepID=A0A940S071_9ACTN|nr:prolyl oligopeptidase family serine peptidase [Streptomyces montanisoli]MBP0460554.1 S9 family peptidase [Streptomyces montanisoli]